MLLGLSSEVRAESWSRTASEPVHAVVALQNGVAYSEGPDIRVEYFDDARQSLTLRGHRDHVVQLRRVPGKEELLSGSWDGSVTHWDLTTNQGQ